MPKRYLFVNGGVDAPFQKNISESQGEISKQQELIKRMEFLLERYEKIMPKLQQQAGILKIENDVKVNYIDKFTKINQELSMVTDVLDEDDQKSLQKAKDEVGIMLEKIDDDESGVTQIEIDAAFSVIEKNFEKSQEKLEQKNRSESDTRRKNNRKKIVDSFKKTLRDVIKPDVAREKEIWGPGEIVVGTTTFLQAQEIINIKDPNLDVVKVIEGYMVTMDYRENRVRVYVDADNKVTRYPFKG